MDPERRPSVNDNALKNIGAAVGLAIMVPSLVVVIENNKPYRHWQDKISNLQGDIYNLHTAETVVGNSSSVQPTIKDLNSRIASKQTAIEVLDHHVPSHLPEARAWH